MNIYSIKDLTAKYYMQPFYGRNHGEAIRSFTNAVNDASNPNNLLAKHPSDFALYAIGEFDEISGKIKETSVEKLGLGSDYVSQQ